MWLAKIERGEGLTELEKLYLEAIDYVLENEI